MMNPVHIIKEGKDFVFAFPKKNKIYVSTSSNKPSGTRRSFPC